jgi:hypothetical protein
MIFLNLKSSILVASMLVVNSLFFNVLNAQVIDYGQWSIPYNPNPKPNKETHEFYLNRYLGDASKFGVYPADKSEDPYVFISKSQKEKTVVDAMNSTSLLSYIMFENGEVSIDELSPAERFGKSVDSKTKLFSMSMGKSVVSYVLGHAICKGTIQGLDHKLNDWPLLEGTLYSQMKILDLINMRAGDQQQVNQSKGFINPQGRSTNPNNFVVRAALDFHFRNTSPDKSYFNYNDMPPNIILNYIIYRSGGGFGRLMNEIFKDKVRVEEGVSFLRQPRGRVDDGLARSSFNATRYDYLRIAKAMLEDWKSDSCVGKYLKDVVRLRMQKDGPEMRRVDPYSSFGAFRGYGGFFHTDYYKLQKGRNVIAMLGSGDQMIVIDFDRERIITTHAIHNDYDWKRIVGDVIDAGGFKK